MPEITRKAACERFAVNPTALQRIIKAGNRPPELRREGRQIIVDQDKFAKWAKDFRETLIALRPVPGRRGRPPKRA